MMVYTHITAIAELCNQRYGAYLLYHNGLAMGQQPAQQNSIKSKL